MSRTFPVSVWAILGLILGIAGCSQEPRPTMAPVNGTVTLNGKPLTKGMVHFIPDNTKGSTGRMAVAHIQPDGRFDGAMCFKPKDGALVGFHKIVIDVRNITPDPPEPGKSPSAPPQPPNLAPVRYSNPDTSGITAEVKAGVTNTFEFKLQSP